MRKINKIFNFHIIFWINFLISSLFEMFQFQMELHTWSVLMRMVSRFCHWWVKQSDSNACSNTQVVEKLKNLNQLSTYNLEDINKVMLSIVSEDNTSVKPPVSDQVKDWAPIASKCPVLTPAEPEHISDEPEEDKQSNNDDEDEDYSAEAIKVCIRSFYF